jgi:formiminotetrahydrofolate cyclodeaminase
MMYGRLTEKPLRTFLDELSGSAPAPGGGSVAALSGALGAALISMVGNLTIGKKKYADVQDEIAELLRESERLRGEFADLLEADVSAFTEVSQAMKMPRGTDEEKPARDRAMDRALKAATDVPMRVAEACVSVMDLCRPTAEKGNLNAVSDVGVGVLMAEAGLRSAALNVLINLGSIKDEAFVKENRTKLDALLVGKSALRDEIYELVVSRL